MSISNKLPNKFKCGGEYYKIRVMKNLLEQTDLYGATNPRCKTVVIDKDVDVASTLLHEMIHISSNFLAAGLREDEVIRIEKYLQMIFVDNKDLLSWILGNINENNRSAIRRDKKLSKRK